MWCHGFCNVGKNGFALHFFYEECDDEPEDSLCDVDVIWYGQRITES
jgi:hypothetical protein